MEYPAGIMDGWAKIPSSTFQKFPASPLIPARINSKKNLSDAYGYQFASALERTIRWETGRSIPWSDAGFLAGNLADPASRKACGYTSPADAQRIKDPGGATKYGHAQASRPWRICPGEPSAAESARGFSTMKALDYFKKACLPMPSGLDPNAKICCCIVEDLTFQNIILSYKMDYWDAIRADEMPAWAAILCFDHAALAGPKSAILCAQQASGSPMDGAIGEMTLAALRKIPEELLPGKIAAARIDDLAKKANFERFKAGWIPRIADKTCY